MEPSDTQPSRTTPENINDNDKSTSSTSPSPAPPTLPPLASTKAPPEQAMERSVSSYRIPSSVFARSTSTTPQDWSVASNESLFSIHTGNMSFTNDHFFLRSGELGLPGEASPSDQMFSYSGHPPTGGGVGDPEMRSHGLEIAEATMKEVIKENEGRSPQTRPLPPEGGGAHRSQGSNASTKSFAFSVKGGETDHKGDQPPEQPQPLMDPAEPQKSMKSEPKTPKATENATPTKWFSCFSSCSCC